MSYMMSFDIAVPDLTHDAWYCACINRTQTLRWWKDPLILGQDTVSTHWIHWLTFLNLLNKNNLSSGKVTETYKVYAFFTFVIFLPRGAPMWKDKDCTILWQLKVVMIREDENFSTFTYRSSPRFWTSAFEAVSWSVAPCMASRL